jgi:hypothetical protein
VSSLLFASSIVLHGYFLPSLPSNFFLASIPSLSDKHQESYPDIQVTPIPSQDEAPTSSMGQTQFFEQEETGARSSDPGEYDGCREAYDEHGKRIGCYVCWETGGIEGVAADEGCLRIE